MTDKEFNLEEYEKATDRLISEILKVLAEFRNKLKELKDDRQRI